MGKRREGECGEREEGGGGPQEVGGKRGTAPSSNHPLWPAVNPKPGTPPHTSHPFLLRRGAPPPPSRQISSYLIMEYCAFGGQSRSLSEGLRAGLFRRLPPSSPPPFLGGDIASSLGGTAAAAAASADLPPAPTPPSHDMKAVFLTARELCLALAHMHSLGVCHGDLSASNVLLSGCPASVEDDRGFIVKVGGWGHGGDSSVSNVLLCGCPACVEEDQGILVKVVGIAPFPPPRKVQLQRQWLPDCNSSESSLECTGCIYMGFTKQSS